MNESYQVNFLLKLLIKLFLLNHWQWIFHRLFRSLEILFSIFLLSMFWHIVGGQWLASLALVALINVYSQYQNSGYIRTDWFNYILVLNIMDYGSLFFFVLFYHFVFIILLFLVYWLYLWIIFMDNGQWNE